MTSEQSGDNKEHSTGRIIAAPIVKEMRTSYLNYAMSVIVGRAIPDVRDGLKPVHRRALFAMGEMGNTSDKAYKKSARVVGDVMGKYHPHGDSAIYETIVKMSQEFSYRHPLIDGQGNFGSIDGDSAAAMRYTEVRLEKIAEELLDDIDKETVDFVPNFDESLKEPSVLPAKVPNLLVNGTSGIAVGMATDMPPHNLGEVCDAVCATIDNPDITPAELMQHIPGPDFPTGGVILGREGIVRGAIEGRGRVKVRGVAEIEEWKGRNRIIISEIPYQVNKATMIELMATLVREKKIEGISDIRDESNKDGIRVVIELKKAAVPMVVLNQLYSHTQLEKTHKIINLAIVNGQPKYLTLKDIIEEFLKHRMEIILRRTQFDLKKAQNRLHILNGLLIALDAIDEIIATIRSSQTTEEAAERLIATFGLDALQADAILKMQLRRLAALETQKIVDEKNVLRDEIARLDMIISDDVHICAEIREETLAIKNKYANPRRTEITHAVGDFDREDLIENKPVFVSLTTQNYIKRMPLETYNSQHRGGRGIIGMNTKEDDIVASVFVANTHDYLLCFTSRGRAHWLKVYNIPESSRIGRGKAIVNLLQLEDEVVTAIIPVSEFSKDKQFIFATRHGSVARISQDKFKNPRSVGIYAIKLRDDDELADVKATDGTTDVILTSRYGQSLRFDENRVRSMGRNVGGVRGMNLRYGDVIENIAIVGKTHLLTITEAGYGKRTPFEQFSSKGRGGMGVRNIKTDLGNGVVSSKPVCDDDEIIVMSQSGIVIRTKVSEISITGRGTKGVRIMRLANGDRVVGFAVLEAEDIEAAADAAVSEAGDIEAVVNADVPDNSEPETDEVDAAEDIDFPDDSEPEETDE